MWIKDQFLGARLYVTFPLWHEPSVCRLSVVCRLVTLLHPTQRFELFSLNIYP